ncbi:MAG: VCBS repeat-containing protein, partial [Planctomycetota bacterium]
MRSTAPGVFAAPVEIAFQPADLVLVGDIEGDGDLDVYVPFIGRVFYNDGAASFTSALAPSAFPFGGDVVLSDVDLDGALDVVFERISVSGTGIALYAGGGAFTPEVQISDRTGPFAVGDVDRDGDPDVVIGDLSSNDIDYLENLGSGTFATPVPVSPFAGSFRSNSLALVDVDGDGLLDLLRGGDSVASGRLQSFLGDGTGDFTNDQGFLFGFGELDELVVQDVDGDADLDVLSALDLELVLLRNDFVLGAEYCASLLNSTGASAALAVTGSRSVASP